MKIIRLFLVSLAERVLNARPMIGMLPRKGTRCSPFEDALEMSPPSTTTPPSSMSTLVLMVRLLVVISTAETEVGATLELSMDILSTTEFPSADICGVTLRMVPTSSRCTV